MKLLIFSALMLLTTAAFTQNTLRTTQELSINGFRNPSIGLEYRYHQVSAHACYYPTNFESGVTTTFIRAGVTAWLLPLGKKTIPSSFYVSGSYLRGLSRDYKNENAFIADVVWRVCIQWTGYTEGDPLFGIARFISDSLLGVALIAVTYRVIHAVTRVPGIRQVIAATSLTTYDFWGRYQLTKILNRSNRRPDTAGTPNA